MKKLALALGSGGARGVAHVGFLQALEEENIPIYAICGASMGSVVGACYASGMQAEEIRAVLKDIRPRKLVDLSLLPIQKLGLLTWRKVRALLNKYLQDKTFENLKIPFSCVAVNVLSGQLEHLQSGNLVDCIMASSAVASIFQPVKIEDKLYIDGGILCRVPVEQAKASGADVVVAVDILENCQQVEKVPNIFMLLTRVFDIIENTSAQRYKQGIPDVCDLWLTPKMPNVNAYKFVYSEEGYQAGYKIGKDNIAKIKELLEME